MSNPYPTSTLIFMLAFFFIFSCSPIPENTTGEKIDILITGATIITSDDARPVIENGFVAIHQGKIIDLGKAGDPGKKYAGIKNIDATGKIVMPGLINTHTHAAMTLFRGMANDLPLQEWLENHIWPAEARFVRGETVHTATLLAIAEMIRSGTTTFCDMYFFEEEVARAAKSSGMRAVVGEGILDFPTPSHASPELALSYTAEMILKWRDDPLISVAIAPHSPYTCSEELLKKCRRLADSLNVRLLIHLSETQKEVSDMQTLRKQSPVEYLQEIGFLGPDVNAAHCVQVSQKDIAILAARKVGVAHNPQSNMKLASGVAPVPAMIHAGMAVGLGTDGVASNNDLNLWEEMNTTSLLQKVILNDPTAMKPETIIKMATIEGAKVLGLDAKTGSLKPGKQADILIVNLDKPHHQPRYDIFSLLVYSADAADVETVVIDGKIVMENRRLLSLDEAEVIANFNRIAAEIKKEMRD